MLAKAVLRRGLAAAATRPLRRVAVVGSGPSGFYAAKYLIKELDLTARIDIFERLPTPFGLVRSGVAPDHPDVKAVQKDFENVAQEERIRFLGNIEIGRDLAVADLQRAYDAVIFAYGAAEDRTLGIPGEELAGVFGARPFVNWYNGHPDYASSNNLHAKIEDALSVEASGRAVVLGQGNVALDCARVLVKSADSLGTTDICAKALDVLGRSRIKEVDVVGRRGHVQAAFTIKELRELSRIEGTRVVADPQELCLSMTDASAAELQESRPKKRLTDLIQTLAQHSPIPNDAARLVGLRFLLLPKAILPDPKRPGHVGSIVMQRAKLEGPVGKQVAVVSQGTVEIPCQMVLRSIGYKSLPLPGLPFDKRRAVVANEKGRVIHTDGAQVEGLYCTGWVKRGPTGIINTNIIDARETVAALLEDVAQGKIKGAQESVDVLDLLPEHKRKEVVTWEGYKKIDDEERRRGEAVGKPREKIVDVTEMLGLALK